jgi:RNA polymerase sigma-70 factor, ECF subfamily
VGDGPADEAPGAVVEALAAERPRLVGLAYRITGSRVDAEDVVQDAWERARRVDPGTIERPAAWLTTVVSRLALDHLRSAQRRRETYVGPWLPEPVVTDAAEDPAEMTELAESLTFGFLRVLEALTPVERAVFVLADVFAVPFPEIAGVVDRTPDACRQIASRARRRVRDGTTRHPTPPDADSVAEELVVALASGQADRVISLLAPDVVLVSDGGPTTHAARRPVVGSDRVSRLMINLTKRGFREAVTFRRAGLNGLPGLLVLAGDRPVLAMAADVEDGKVSAIFAVVSPDKLAALRLTGPLT